MQQVCRHSCTTVHCFQTSSNPIKETSLDPLLVVKGQALIPKPPRLLPQFRAPCRAPRAIAVVLLCRQRSQRNRQPVHLLLRSVLHKPVIPPRLCCHISHFHNRNNSNCTVLPARLVSAAATYASVRAFAASAAVSSTVCRSHFCDCALPAGDLHCTAVPGHSPVELNTITNSRGHPWSSSSTSQCSSCSSNGTCTAQQHCRVGFDSFSTRE